jgi:amyotrophic lateral sclerosis 2 protein
MNEVHLWFGLEKLTLTFEPSNLSKNVIKLCKLNRHIFALTSSNNIYHSELDRNCDKLVFTNTNITAIDITCNNKILYFVTDNGQVFKTNPENLDVKEEIILKEDAKCCCHGYKTSEQKVKVKTIAAEECSCLYVTENGQLWVSGDQPKLGMHDEVPQKVSFFEKRYVISVACGTNFSIALVYKPGQFVPDKDNSDTDDDNEDVFVSDCPLCISSPTSQQSASETCPLGLCIQQTSDENYSTSSTSKENTIEDKKSTDDSTSVSTDGKADKKSKICDAEKELHAQLDADFHADKTLQSFVECNDNRRKTGKVIWSSVNESESEFMKEEKKNEFFINTEAARQFLTRQLSWVSSYGGAGEDRVECAEASLASPSRIIKQNMTNMANLVYEGVKTVGDRGAILFRHMSGGSGSNESVRGGLADCGSFEEISAEDFIIAVPSITSSLRYCVNRILTKSATCE